jgi:cytochrome c556
MKNCLRLAALGLLVMASAALAQGDVIAERREGLKRMGAHMEAMKPVADARGDPRPLLPRIEEMIVFFRDLPDRFPPGSDRGDTRALPAVWTNRASFEEAHARMMGQLAVLRDAAAAGDRAAFASAYAATGPQFCGGCHRPFRSR